MFKNKDNEFILKIEGYLKDIDNKYKIKELTIINNTFSSLIKNYLISEFYFKREYYPYDLFEMLEMIIRFRPRNIYELTYNYYNSPTAVSKWGRHIPSKIYYALTYNDKSIRNAELIIKYVELSFNQFIIAEKSEAILRKYISGSHELLRKSLQEFFYKYFVDINILPIVRIDYEYFEKLVAEYYDNIVSMVSLNHNGDSVMLYIKESIKDSLTEYINSRKSPTRGMESGSPLPYIKGTICLLSLGIRLADDMWSYLKKKEWDAIHFSNEPEPAVTNLDERLRNVLAGVAAISGLTWFHGCKPVNY